MKNLYCLFLGLSLLSVTADGQTIPRPNIPAPAGLAVNSFTGNLFFQRNEQSLRGTGYRIYQSFYYNAAQDTLNYGYGHGWSFYYNVFYREEGSRVIIHHADAKKDTFLLQGGAYQSPAGVFDVLTKSGSQFTLTSKSGDKHIFADATHKRITRMDDANGNFVTIAYAGGNPVTITNSSGRSLLLTWENGLLKEAKDGTDPTKKFTYAYNSARDLISVTNPLGGQKSFAYKNHYLVRLSDENNNPVVIYYAGSGGKVKQITSCNTEQRFTYLNAQRKTFVTQKAESGNLVTGYSFDTEGRLAALTDADGNRAEFTYDAKNNLLARKDFKGLLTQFTYDSRGNVLKETDPRGKAVEYTYESVFNRPVTVKDRRGNTTTLSYDAKGNLTTVVRPGNLTDTFTYDAAGRRLTAKNANGNTTTYQYNTDGDLVKIQYPVGAVQYQYNGNCCNVGKITDANGNTLEMTYDLLNRTKTVKDAQGNTTAYDYDAVGNVVKETDPNGIVKEYGYDGLNRLNTVKLAVGTWEYDYDGQSNLIKMTDANGHETRYAYDRKNQLISETDPAGHSVKYAYDVSGHLTQRNDPNGNAVNYTYDELDRLTEKSYTGNTDKYSYDEAGNLIGASNNNIAYSFEYDNLNRLLKKNITTWGKALAYTYDAVGNRKTMTDHDGGVTTYTYDANNRLASLKNPANLTTTFDYDAGGRLKKQTNGNGTFTTYHYDVAGRMDSLNNWKTASEKISFFYYTFDQYGNRKTMQDKRGLHTYTYDSAYRLTSVNYADGSTESFTLDGSGNRTQRTKNGVVTPYTYNPADQIQTAGPTSFTFDANGNTVGQNDGRPRVYRYDGENRLLDVQLNPQRKVQYKYDPFGDKIEKQDTLGLVTKMLYDGDNLLGELNPANVTQNAYTTAFGMDSWLSMKTGGNNYFYHKDGLNSTVELTGANAAIASQYNYDAYGNVLSQSGSVNNTILYTGRLYEGASKLYDYRTRFYDSKIGRFINEDYYKGSIVSAPSLNKFNYVHSSPINYNDPHGTNPFVVGGAIVIGTIVGAIIGAGAGGYGYGYTDDHINRNYINEQPGMVPDVNMHVPGWERQHIDKTEYHQKNQGDKASWDREKYEKIYEDGSSSEAIWDKTQNRWLECGESGGPSYNYFHPTNKDLDFKNWSFNDWLTATGHGIYDILPHRARDNYNCPPEPKDGSKDPLPPTPNDTPPTPVTPVGAVDPNEIIGPAGYDSTNHWVAAKQSLPYKVLFENDPDFATAPAQRVTVYVPIHPKLNPSSLRISDFGFGSFNFTVPANTSIYTNRLDVRDSLGVFVEVTAGLDVANRRAFWIFQSIDPATGLAATLPPNSGFLPVNDSLKHNGEGYVTFTLRPSALAQTRDTVTAEASIIFDTEETIRTNKWVNTVDAKVPASRVKTLPNQSNTAAFDISWEGQDDTDGSGIRNYDLYVSENTGPFTLYQAGLTGTSTKFTGTKGNTYCFFTLANDNVGNQEAVKSACEATIQITPENIPVLSGLPVSGSGCVGQNFVLTASCASGTVQWQGSPAGTVNGNSITLPTAAGTYSYSAICSQGGTVGSAATTTFVVNAPPQSVTAVNSGPLSCTNTTVTLTGSSSTTGVSYSWLGPDSYTASSATAVASAPGIYTLTVNNSGCTATASTTVVGGANSLTASVSPSSATLTCTSPTASLTASGGSTYRWNTGATTPILSVSAAGPYSVTVTATGGCTATASATVSGSASQPTASLLNSGPLSCSTTSVTLTASGGSTYRFSSGATQVGNGPIATVSTAGVYSVTVSNAGGCTATGSTTVVGDASVPTASISPSSATLTCASPTVSLTASGGVNYRWNTGATTPSISVSTTGTYSVTVTNASGCKAIASATVVGDQSLPIASIAGTQTICSGQSTTLTASGGTSYVWSNGATTPAISVSTAGTYSVTAVNAAGCQSTTSVSVTVSPAPSVSISASPSLTISAGQSATLTASGGSTYRWSNGASSPAISVSVAGTYSVTATSAAGCQASASAVVSVTTVTGPPLVASVTPSQVVGCVGLTGVLSATASGGSAPYSYSWTTPEGVALSGTSSSVVSFSLTSAGVKSISVVVSSAGGGPVSTATISVTANPLPSVSISASPSLTISAGQSATLTASGGASYRWSNGASSPAISVSVAGTYSVTATSATGCSSSVSAIVSVTTASGPPLVASVTPSQVVGCVGLTGVLSATASGGSAPYSYSWVAPEGVLLSATNTRVVSGTLTTAGVKSISVVVSSAGGGPTSTATISVTANALPSPSISASPSLTISAGQSATLTASGGSTYRWSNGASSPAISVSVAGTYSVTATSSAGCSATASAIVSVTTASGPPLVVSVTPSQVVGCVGLTGVLSATASGGSAPYSYDWTAPEGVALSGTSSSAVSFSLTSAGVKSISVVVSSAGGGPVSTATISVTANALPSPSISASPSLTISAGQNTTLTASGGSTYRWSNGASSPAISVSTAGTYSVTAVNGAGCQATASAVVSVTTASGPPLVVSVTPSQVVGCVGLTGVLSATASGGSAPYSYSWVAPEGVLLSATNTRTVSGTLTSAGVKSITVVVSSAGGGPVSTATISATATPGPTLSITGNLSLCAGQSTTLTAGGGSTYRWSNGASSPAISVSVAGTYSVTGVSASGCSSTTSVSVLVSPLPSVSISASPSLTISAGQSTTLTASSGTTYQWSTGASSPAISVSTAGTYSVTATSGAGCRASASAVVSVTTASGPPLVVSVTPSQVVGCVGLTGVLSATASGGSAPYSYSWVAPEGVLLSATNTRTVSGTLTTAGVKSISVVVSSAGGGPTSTATISVTANTLPSVSISPTSGTLSCASPELSLTALGSAASYRWNTGATTPAISVTTAGTYSVTAISSSGCSTTVSAVIEQKATNPVVVNVGVVGTLSCARPSLTLDAAPLVSDPTQSYTYSFTGPDGVLVGSGSVRTVTVPGSYTVVITPARGCPFIRLATVTGTLTPPIINVSPANQKVCKGTDAVLSIQAQGASLTYEWFRNSFETGNKLSDDGSFKGTATNSLTVVATQRSDNYLVRVTGNCGLVERGPFAVTVDTNCNGRKAALTTEDNSLQVSVNPNPLTDGHMKVVVKGAGGEALHLTLTNLQGLVLYEQRLPVAAPTETIQWSISNQSPGVYLLQATTPTQHQTVKVIR